MLRFEFPRRTILLQFIVLASAGALLSFGLLAVTKIMWLIPADSKRIWVRSGCTAADAAVRAARHAEPWQQLYLIPLDQDGDLAHIACLKTLAALEHRGYRWLGLFPTHWLCQRFAEDAYTRAGEDHSVPRFYDGDTLLCDGLCDRAFERLGYPDLQQFVTLLRPAQSLD